MGNVFYFQIDFVSLLALLILLVHSAKNLRKSQSNTMFQVLVCVTLMIHILDYAAWHLDGMQNSFAGVLLNVSNILYLGSVAALGCFWFLLVLMMLNPKLFKALPKWSFVLLSLPFFLFFVILASSPWTHIIFSVDAQNVYHRESGFWIYSAVSYLYILVATVYALHEARRTLFRLRRRECLSLASFVVFPFLGSFVQLFFYGLNLFPPSLAISIILIYINLQYTQISVDTLTGLTNRTQFELYFAKRLKQKKYGPPWFLVVIDVDDFKTINDAYGHYAGDQVLRNIADKMNETFKNTDALLSRYGGDEFTILVSCRTAADLENLLEKLRAALKEELMVEFHAISTSISVGYVRYDIRIHTSPYIMQEQADRLMYKEKDAKKGV